MSTTIQCREAESLLLEQSYQSNKPEFLAVCGRRRVGKTYLIKEFFSKKNAVFFKVTGTQDAPMTEQIKNFTDQLANAFYKGAALSPGKNWRSALRQLTKAIDSVDKNKKIILFFDEFPWMVTKNSRLLQMLSYFWNEHWSGDKRIKLIICGSATSWIIKKIIHNKGGLHNRVTREIYLEPFNLRETKRFLNLRGIKLNNQHILNIYMATGGVAFYLNQVEKGLSSTQVIEQLAFRRRSFLMEEFDKLYAALFGENPVYVEIVRTIAKHHYGMSQEALFNTVKSLPKGESGLSRLNELEKNGFIMSFIPYKKESGIYYKVIDEYSLFYFHWIEPIKNSLLAQGMRKGYWEQLMKSPAWYSWSGLAFETICYKHISQISTALQLNPTAIPHTWRFISSKGSNEDGVQIDLLFDRNDDAITIIEIKHTQDPLYIDKQIAKNLQMKMDVFKSKTKTKKQLFLAIVSANGIKKSMYSEEMLDSLVTL